MIRKFERYFDEKACVQYMNDKGIKISVHTLRAKRVHGGGPPFVKICGKIFYPDVPLDDWIESFPVLKSTAQMAA